MPKSEIESVKLNLKKAAKKGKRRNAMKDDEPQQTSPTEAEVELLKLEWQRKTFWWEWLGKLVAPLIAAVAVVLIGGRFLADLKPIHLETGNAKFDVSQMDKSCVCRNTVRKSRVASDGPLDAEGRLCGLSPTAVERNDLPDVGEPYYLTSDFVPHASMQDRRCYRQSIVHVRHSFSQTPKVSLQLSWMDAITVDTTEDGVPILVGGGNGEPRIQKGLNLRFDLKAANVTTEGFDICLKDMVRQQNLCSGSLLCRFHPVDRKRVHPQKSYAELWTRVGCTPKLNGCGTDTLHLR